MYYQGVEVYYWIASKLHFVYVRSLKIPEQTYFKNIRIKYICPFEKKMHWLEEKLSKFDYNF